LETHHENSGPPDKKDEYPFVLLDGKDLSFNSNRLAPIINKPIVGGPGNTYWVSARIIENFLSQVLD